MFTATTASTALTWGAASIGRGSLPRPQRQMVHLAVNGAAWGCVRHAGQPTFGRPRTELLQVPPASAAVSLPARGSRHEKTRRTAQHHTEAAPAPTSLYFGGDIFWRACCIIVVATGWSTSRQTGVRRLC